MASRLHAVVRERREASVEAPAMLIGFRSVDRRSV